jgi:hypothetical protein
MTVYVAEEVTTDPTPADGVFTDVASAYRLLRTKVDMGQWVRGEVAWSATLSDGQPSTITASYRAINGCQYIRTWTLTPHEILP